MTEKRPGLIRRLAGRFAGIFLGAVLLLAAYAKWIEPGAFVEQIRLEGLDLILGASVVAVIALALETALGLLLVTGIRRYWVLVPTAALTAFFIFLTGRNYWLVSQGLRDPDESCGCFGSLIERTPAEAFYQDLLLLVPPLLVLFWAAQRGKKGFPRFRLALALAMAVVIGGWTWLSPEVRFADEAALLAAEPADESFAHSDGYRVFIDGQPAKNSRVYISEGRPELLVVSPDLPSSLLVNPQNRRLHLVPSGGLRKESREKLSLKPKIGLVEAGEFELGPGGILFRLGKQSFLIRVP